MRIAPLPVIIFIAIGVASCAGRDPEPIQTVLASDSQASCTQIRAEIEANNIKVKALADEQGLKVAQNVVAGVGGFFTLGLTWFALDAKGSASKDVTSLQARQQYLATLATEKCASPNQVPVLPPQQSKR